MNKEQRILASNVLACEQRVSKLLYSVNKVRPFFPLLEAQLDALSDEQEESIDALILRYSQTVAMIQDHLFRGIAYVEQEDISDKSNRDKTLLMEKLGAIRSAEEFGTAAVLRNKFAHHYPEQAAERLERLNLIIEESDFVITAFADIQAYLKRKQILPVA
ncbi:hypothetical protein [Marinobacterium stanieri]|uniref:hypothetical protein n=1 Tax=Marinobacterium stanieri TaxID=49186 RepID=UPI0002558C21|nr:hypothetical protein [Marinobacterium stanieri]